MEGTTESKILAISPVFSYSPDGDRFCVIDKGRVRLEEVGRRLTAEETGGLVAIYVVEQPEPEYNDGPSTHGRVVALVRPLPMPSGRHVQDYPSGCIDAKKLLQTGARVDRWPVGWPCEVVFYSAHGGPALRDAVYTALHRDYGTFTHQFLQGPIDLSKYAYRPLRHRLLQEVHRQIELNPQTRIRSF